MIFWKRKFLEKILITWTEKYDPIIATIEESKDIDKLIAIELMGSPEAHKKRLEMSCENDIENNFQSITNTQSQESKKSWRKFNEEKKKIIIASILYVAFAKEKVTRRRTIGLKESHSAEIVKNTDM